MTKGLIVYRRKDKSVVQKSENNSIISSKFDQEALREFSKVERGDNKHPFVFSEESEGEDEKNKPEEPEGEKSLKNNFGIGLNIQKNIRFHCHEDHQLPLPKLKSKKKKKVELSRIDGKPNSFQPPKTQLQKERDDFSRKILNRGGQFNHLLAPRISSFLNREEKNAAPISFKRKIKKSQGLFYY